MHHFEHYDYFLAILEKQSIAKASEKLLLSQPYLSQYLRKLEDELQVKLFDRTKRPLQLTSAGRQYLEYIEEFRRVNDRLNESLGKKNNNTLRSISMGMSYWRSYYLLSKILQKYTCQYPDMHIQLHEGGSEFLNKSLNAGNLDICIINASYNSPQYICDVLYNERLLLVAPKDHYIVNEHYRNIEEIVPIDLMLLRNQRFIMLGKGNLLHTLANILFEKYYMNPDVVLATNMPSTALRMVAAGIGFCFTFELATKHFDEMDKVRFFSLETPNLVYPLSIIYRKDLATPPFCALVDIIKEVCSINKETNKE